MKTLRVVCALFWLGCGWCAGDAVCIRTQEHLESFRGLCPLPGLTRPERDCFIECFSGLGRMEAEQECQRLAFYQERFTLFLQQAQEHARPQLELSHKLGFAAGLAAAILCL